MSDLDLDAIKECERKATPGPWHVPKKGGTAFIYHGDDDGDLLVNYSDGEFHERADAVFCARARQDIPTLIAAYEAKCAEVERLRAENLKFKAANEELRAEIDEQDIDIGKLKHRVERLTVEQS